MKLSSDWDSVVTGSLDISIKSVVSSPSFLSADAGYGFTPAFLYEAHYRGQSCILAVVSTNLELSLWCSVKNQLAGQWVKVSDSDIRQGNYIRLTPGQLQDATSYLQSLAAAQTTSRLQQTLRTQVVCMLTWLSRWNIYSISPDRFILVEAAGLRYRPVMHQRWFSFSSWE
jgi:general transcription factor 3C polypeptide 4